MRAACATSCARQLTDGADCERYDENLQARYTQVSDILFEFALSC